MRHFLLRHWSLSLATLTWSLCLAIAIRQAQTVPALLALAALIANIAFTGYLYRSHKRSAKAAVPASPPGPHIAPAPVERDADGYWTHPAYPVLADDDHNANGATWFKTHHLETSIALLEDEGAEHPACARYWDERDPDANISAWNPPRPPGDGWFMLSIHDTETWGPVCVWARPGVHGVEGV